MNRKIAAAALALALAAAAQTKRPITPQAQRGQDLFLKSEKGAPCGTCHAVAGVGTAVGPDRAPDAGAATPKGIVMTIRMEMTENVVSVKAPGGTFPGIEKSRQADQVEIWDLSQKPPALRSFKPKEISTTRETKWKHPPAEAQYTSQELADIIGFLKWAAKGSQTVVKASDIDGGQ